MAGSYGVADGTGPLLQHVGGTTTGGMTTGGMTTGGITTAGITTAGTTGASAGASGSAIGIGKLIPGISASGASAGAGAGILAHLAVVGAVLLTGAVFAGVGLLCYAITKAAIEPDSD